MNTDKSELPLFLSLLHDADQMESQSFYSMAERLRAASKEVGALNAVAEAANTARAVGQIVGGSKLTVSAALSNLATIRSQNK